MTFSPSDPSSGALAGASPRSSGHKVGTHPAHVTLPLQGHSHWHGVDTPA